MKPRKRNSPNVLSKLTFWWMNPLFHISGKRRIEEQDLHELREKDLSINVCEQLEKTWKKEVKLTDDRDGKPAGNRKRKPSLLRAVLKTYWLRILFVGICQTIEETIRVSIPIVISELVKYFDVDNPISAEKAYLYGGLTVFFAYFLSVFAQNYGFKAYCFGWNLKNAACVIMYKKTLRLSQKSLSQTASGQIVNLSASDVFNFDEIFFYVNYMWIGIVELIVVTIILWNDLGSSILYGVLVILLLMIITMMTGRLYGKFRLSTAVLSDKRVHYMNEIIAGMRIIKMYTWEKPFAKIIQDVRKKEVFQILVSSLIRVISFSLDVCYVKILALIVFTVFIYTGGNLTTSILFKAMGIFFTLRLSIGAYFSRGIEIVAKSIITINRIEAFLLLEEIDDEARVETIQPGKPFLELESFSANWSMISDSTEHNQNQNSMNATLEDISFRVNAGELLAIIGPVGSGKSSLLIAILKELPAYEGRILVSGKVTYADQTSWVFSASVRENILFGEEYDHLWYQKVVFACALTKDINSFPHGDQTLVGERGVTLSGGQKARVNLARAVYRKDASICLLDDPLSAVDASVGNHIFQHCISGLLKDKVCILVTHQLRFLENVDKIIMLKEGKISTVGTYQELLNSSQEFSDLLKELESDEDPARSNDIYTSPAKYPRKSNVNQSNNKKHDADDSESTPLLKEGEVQTVEEEERAVGNIGFRVYFEYFQIGNNTLLLILLVIFILISRSLFIVADWWIAQWGARNDYKEASYRLSVSNATALPDNFTFTDETSAIKIESVSEKSVYIAGQKLSLDLFTELWAVITISIIVTLMISQVIVQFICYKSSLNMHDKMFKAILKAPIRFFDINPVGRILNRFAKDMAQIDQLTPNTLIQILFLAGYLVSVLLYTSTVSYFIGIFVLLMLFVLYWILKYYLRTSRDFKRLEGTTRSPVFSLLSSTLYGLTTIRAYRVEKSFVEKYHQLQDKNGAAWYLYLAGIRWMGIRFDFVVSSLIAFATFLFLLMKGNLPIEAYQVGLTLTYLNGMLGLFQFLVRSLAEWENQMTSAERIQQYYKIEPEADHEVRHMKPPADWPMHGNIHFQNVSLAYYKGGPTILKNLNFTIKSEEKIGIVGRTGAGKSSLISALFRLVELTGGEIYIDGIPITPLGLNDLRKVISIIPQDPVLFTGTMRYNLDPFSHYKDEELWNALEQVQLKEVVESLPLKLSSELAESGSNFSVGQRQLVCLARAILRKSKILVIDEATANVDLKTDVVIQQAIRVNFKHCTVLTIAHRLETIGDSDRILVMDAGMVKEFDTPKALLENPNSLYSNFIRERDISSTSHSSS